MICVVHSITCLETVVLGFELGGSGTPGSHMRPVQELNKGTLDGHLKAVRKVGGLRVSASSHLPLTATCLHSLPSSHSQSGN